MMFIWWIGNQFVAIGEASTRAFDASLTRLRCISAAAALALVCVPFMQSAMAQNIGDSTVWLVDGISGSDSDSGQGQWSEAFLTIDKARSMAQAGHQIWVRSTTYRLGSAGSTFELKDGVWLLGGFDTSDTERTDADPYANPTILSGDVSNNDNPGNSATWTDNAYHVVRASNTVEPLTRLDGFIIEGGNATNGGGEPYGGGLYFTGNASDNGIALVVTRCRFRQNHALVSGGAAAVHRNGGVSFTRVSGQFINCEFTDNDARSGGGGIWVYAAAIDVTNSLFVSNTATYGGGIYVEQNRADVPVDHCDGFGELIFQQTSATTRNCTFAENTATLGGGVYAERGIAGCQLKSSIFWGNSDSASTSIERQQIAQNIYCGENDDPAVIASDCCIETDGSLVEYDFGNNIDDDPLFAGASVHLRPSPRSNLLHAACVHRTLGNHLSGRHSGPPQRVSSVRSNSH